MVGIPENGMTLVGVGRRSRSGPNFEAVRTAIGLRYARSIPTCYRSHYPIG